MGLGIYDEYAPTVSSVTITAADGTTPVDLTMDTTGRCRFDTLLVYSTAYVPMGIELMINGTPNIGLGVFLVPAGSGSDGTNPAIDLLGAMVATGLSELVLQSGQSLSMRVTASLTDAHTIRLAAFGGLV